MRGRTQKWMTNGDVIIGSRRWAEGFWARKYPAIPKPSNSRADLALFPAPPEIYETQNHRHFRKSLRCPVASVSAGTPARFWGADGSIISGPMRERLAGGTFRSGDETLAANAAGHRENLRQRTNRRNRKE